MVASCWWPISCCNSRIVVISSSVSCGLRLPSLLHFFFCFFSTEVGSEITVMGLFWGSSSTLHCWSISARNWTLIAPHSASLMVRSWHHHLCVSALVVKGAFTCQNWLKWDAKCRPLSVHYQITWWFSQRKRFRKLEQEWSVRNSIIPRHFVGDMAMEHNMGLRLMISCNPSKNMSTDYSSYENRLIMPCIIWAEFTGVAVAWK